MSQGEFKNQAKTKVTRVTRSTFIRFVGSSSVQRIDISPLSSSFFGADLAYEAALYQQFRCVGITVRLYPIPDADVTAGNAQTNMVIGYTPAAQYSPSTSAAEVAALSVCAVQATACTQVQTFSLSKKDLLRPMRLKWCHLRSVSPDPDTDLQGAIYYVSSGTNAATAVNTWLIQSTWEFINPVTANEELVRIRRKTLVDGNGLDPAPSSLGEWELRDIGNGDLCHVWVPGQASDGNEKESVADEKYVTVCEPETPTNQARPPVKRAPADLPCHVSLKELLAFKASLDKGS